MNDVVLLADECNSIIIDRVCRGVASIQEGKQLRQYVERLQLIKSLLLRAREWVKGPHYISEYGEELEPQLDSSPQLLKEIDACLGIEHKSDCALNNAPAKRIETCDCGAQP